MVTTFNRPIVIRDYAYNPRKRESLSKTPFMQTFFNSLDTAAFIEIIENMRKYRDKFSQIKKDFDESCPEAPFWDNIWLPPLDGITLYTFLAEFNPRYYVECGSGNTTKFAARSIQDNNLRTKIISIDPYPRAEINALCHEIYRVPFENMDLRFFEELTAEDIFLVDNSHRSFPNSDVTVFFTEVLPILPPGMLYAIHDIFLPDDYPEEWNDPQRRFYNEQYLLASYLLGGAMRDTVHFPCYYSSQVPALQNAVWQAFNDEQGLPVSREIHAGGGLFWLKKGNPYRDDVAERQTTL